jgi:hypothetical protein
LSQVVGDLYLEVFESHKDPQLVPVVDDLGQPAGDNVRLGQVVMRSRTPSDVLAKTVAARFADGRLLLNGYDLSSTTIHPGETLSVTLHWQAIQPPSTSLHVFVHLLDEEGQLIAQHDGPPRLGLYPTWAWTSQETIVDVHPVQIPAAVEGVIRVSVGLYSPASLERISVTDSAGASYPTRALPLTTIVVD